MTVPARISLSLLVLSFALMAAADDTAGPDCRATEPVRAEPPPDASADPFGWGPWYVNADQTLWAGADVVRMKAGPKGNKVLWIRPAGTRLTVSGRRLDGNAPPMQTTIPCCYPTGFQVSGIAFPTGGCWEIVATAGKSTLVFVTRVAPGNGRR